MSNANDISGLLDRETFRNAVFSRDGHRCVMCGSTEKLDAHHIIERRIWDDGGYYLDNGATLCDDAGRGCHMRAEMTLLSCDQIRATAGIRRVLIPDHLYADYRYDKWGNIIHPDGTRTKGELFSDESVQKVLEAGGVLRLFRKYIKYPRTYHLPSSPGATSDDRRLADTSIFMDKEIVIMEKMDGENTTLYRDYMHARSLDEDHHESRGWVKNLHSQIAWQIDEGWRICGENLYALHSVPYDSLPTYFMVFSIWDENNVCLSWDDTVLYAQVLGLETVPVLYRGIFDPTVISSIEGQLDTSSSEGFVVRLAGSFGYSQFRRSVAKWVRAGHVQTTHNWKMRAVVKNGIRGK